jgi:hypothetical protein
MGRYLMNYVGTGLYSIENFAREAQAIGVNRSFPPALIKNVKFGDKILLATFKMDENEWTENRKRGKATVFGFYIVDGMGITGSPEVKTELRNSLTLTEYEAREYDVNRECGSYRVTSNYTVTEDLPRILEILHEICVRLGQKVKVFLNGRFVGMPSFDIEGVAFTRTALFVDIEQELEAEMVDRSITEIEQYERRTYWTRSEARARGLRT